MCVCSSCAEERHATLRDDAGVELNDVSRRRLARLVAAVQSAARALRVSRAAGAGSVAGVVARVAVARDGRAAGATSFAPTLEPPARARLTLSR